MMNRATSVATSFANGVGTVAKTAGNVVVRTTQLGVQAFEHFTIPANKVIGTAGSLAGSAVSSALYNWGRHIMARSLINSAVVAGGQYGLPAWLCRLGAVGYMSAVGAPAMPASVVAASGIATTLLFVGISNAIAAYVNSGKTEEAQDAANHLETAAEQTAREASELSDQASVAERKFKMSYSTVTEQMVRAEALQAQAAAETNLTLKVDLENETLQLFKNVNDLLRQANTEQQAYLKLSAQAKEAAEATKAAELALEQAHTALNLVSVS